MCSIKPMFLDCVPLDIFEIMQDLGFIGFFLICLKMDKRKCIANNPVIYFSFFNTKTFFFFLRQALCLEKTRMSADNEVFILVMEMCWKVMEKSWKSH